MDKIAKKTLNEKLKLPFVVVLIGVLVLIVGIFLPYMTAVGDMAEYIEKNPDRVEINALLNGHGCMNCNHASGIARRQGKTHLKTTELVPPFVFLLSFY